jgi:hypothetical protein
VAVLVVAVAVLLILVVAELFKQDKVAVAVVAVRNHLV